MKIKKYVYKSELPSHAFFFLLPSTPKSCFLMTLRDHLHLFCKQTASGNMGIPGIIFSFKTGVCPCSSSLSGTCICGWFLRFFLIIRDNFYNLALQSLTKCHTRERANLDTQERVHTMMPKYDLPQRVWVYDDTLVLNCLALPPHGGREPSGGPSPSLEVGFFLSLCSCVQGDLGHVIANAADPRQLFAQ